MSKFYDADIVINLLIEKKLIANIDWKKYNNSKYTASFNKEGGLNGIISFEITAKDEKHLIRFHNLILCLSHLNLSEEEINKLMKSSLV